TKSLSLPLYPTIFSLYPPGLSHSLSDGSQLKRGEEVLPIIPGMVAEVDILSGKRSVLNYLLRPLIKARLY
ncbi:hypothetical protein N1E82_31435, partial [Pseudomonas aeruginosa]|nr:hypothetical protein [Pseudomonas aeruginosa]MCS9230710.1 hypothetical protein [Pseudomonas aeruginosa]